jgi:hypothetical protein
MDQCMTVYGGLKKGTLGFFDDVGKGVTGIYKVPRERIRKQGMGTG